jgi:hypothetical protein
VLARRGCGSVDGEWRCAARSEFDGWQHSRLSCFVAPMATQSDRALDENSAQTSVGADEGFVFGCCYHSCLCYCGASIGAEASVPRSLR